MFYFLLYLVPNIVKFAVSTNKFTIYASRFCPSQKSPPESALAKILEHSNSLDVPTDVSWGINDMIAGKHAMTSPRASLTYIMHTTFSKVNRGSVVYEIIITVDWRKTKFIC